MKKSYLIPAIVIALLSWAFISLSDRETKADQERLGKEISKANFGFSPNIGKEVASVKDASNSKLTIVPTPGFASDEDQMAELRAARDAAMKK